MLQDLTDIQIDALATRENRSKSSMTESASEPRTSTSPELDCFEPVARCAGHGRVSFYCEAPSSESEGTKDSNLNIATRESIQSSASGRYLAEVAPFLCSNSPQLSVEAESHAEQMAAFFAAISPPAPSATSVDQRGKEDQGDVIADLRRQIVELEMCVCLELRLAFLHL